MAEATTRPSPPWVLTWRPSIVVSKSSMWPDCDFCITTSFSASPRGPADARGGAQLGGQQAPFVDLAVAGDRRVDRDQHVGRQHVGQEAEAAAVDAEQRRAALGDQAGREQQRAVAADRHDQVGAGGQLGFGNAADHRAGEAVDLVVERQRRDAARGEVLGQQAGAFGDPRRRRTG